MTEPVEQDFEPGDEFDPFDPSDTGRAQALTLSLQEAADLTIQQRLERRQLAYKRMLGNLAAEDREIIDKDLAWFCMGDRAVFHENERVHVLLTGRQEVWQRIQDHTRLSLDDLVAKYIRPQLKDQ